MPKADVIEATLWWGTIGFILGGFLGLALAYVGC